MNVVLFSRIGQSISNPNHPRYRTDDAQILELLAKAIYSAVFWIIDMKFNILALDYDGTIALHGQAHCPNRRFSPGRPVWAFDALPQEAGKKGHSVRARRAPGFSVSRSFFWPGAPTASPP
jgi:hypothetical protein